MRIVFLTLLAAACAKPNYQDVQPTRSTTLRFAKAGFSADWQWDKYPTDTVTGSLFVKFWKSTSSNPVFSDPGYQPAIYLWMPDMGHGSSKVQIDPADPKNPGVFHVSNVYFIMHGVWEIHFQLKSQDTVVDESVATVHY